MIIRETYRLFDFLLLKFIRLDKDNLTDQKENFLKKILTFLEN